MYHVSNLINVKGLKCTSCGFSFKWNEATNRNSQGLQLICNCPECNQKIMSNIPIIHYVMIIILFACILFIPAGMIAFLNINEQGIFIIVGVIFFILGFIVPRLLLTSGYLLMHKVSD